MKFCVFSLTNTLVAYIDLVFGRNLRNLDPTNVLQGAYSKGGVSLPSLHVDFRSDKFIIYFAPSHAHVNIKTGLMNLALH